MSKGKVTPFKGSKLHVQTGVSVTTEAITAVTATNPGTISIAATALLKGDVVTIAGVGEGFDGSYVVSGVVDGTPDVVTLADADWSSLTPPGSYASATAAEHEFSADWCEITSINHGGANIPQDDVSTICSTRQEFEAGLAGAGTLQLGFNFAPATSIQKKLVEYEKSGDKFFVRLVLPRQQGTMLYYGSISTGRNMDGAVSGHFTSGVTLQLSGDYYHIEAV